MIMRSFKLRNLILLYSILILLIPIPSFAQTYAYLIGTDGEVLKFDIDADNIVSTRQLKNAYLVQSEKQSVVADNTKKLLYVVHGRLTPGVSVFDLKTLELKKDLGIISGSPDVMVIAPTLSNKFYVEWWSNDKNESVFSSYDTNNFTKIADLKPSPIITEDILYSNDNAKLYSINDGYPAKIDVYNTANLELIKSIPLGSVFTPNIFGRGIDDYKNEKVLIVENVKASKAEPSKYTLYTYAIESGMMSPKILTGMKGSARLSIDAAKSFFDEEQDIFTPDGSVDYEKSLGRLHVYDVATGNNLGFVQYTVDKGSDFLGIHPSGNKVYMIGDIVGVKSLLVMDIVNFKVVKTIKIPNTILFMIFYDE